VPLTTVAGQVLGWLEADGDGCLVVFDDVRDAADVRPFLPAVGKSRVVITSAEPADAPAAAGLGTPLPVDVFTRANALAFLAKRTGLDDAGGAAELAAEVGFLPLALSLVGAVIAAERLDYPACLRRLRSVRARGRLTAVDADPYPRGLGEAVLLAMDAAVAADQTGLTRDLIDVVSLLSPADVPPELFYAAGPFGVYAGPGDRRRRKREVPSSAIDQALALLADLSLLTFEGDGCVVRAHPLVAHVVRERRAHDGGMPALGSRLIGLIHTALMRSLFDDWSRVRDRSIVAPAIALRDHLAPHAVGDRTRLSADLLDLRHATLLLLLQLGDTPDQAVEVGEQLLPITNTSPAPSTRRAGPPRPSPSGSAR